MKAELNLTTPDPIADLFVRWQVSDDRVLELTSEFYVGLMRHEQHQLDDTIKQLTPDVIIESTYDASTGTVTLRRA